MTAMGVLEGILVVIALCVLILVAAVFTQGRERRK
jgi:hypothetical protein